MGEWMQTYISTLDAVGDVVPTKCGERDLEGSRVACRGRHGVRWDALGWRSFHDGPVGSAGTSYSGASALWYSCYGL